MVPRFNVRLLSAGPFVTMVDRFALAPLLIPIASDFHVPLGKVAGAATAYYLVYGLAQPFWGFVSDRFGRIHVIRLSLGMAAAGCVLSAIAPNVDLLIAARILDGMAVCAVLPTALVYIGDMVPFNLRHSVIADVLAAVAVGTTVGSLGAGLFAHFLNWRFMFLVPALIAFVLVFAMKQLPESKAAPPSGGPLNQLVQAVRRPWARFLILFAIPEGAMVLGFIVYFAPAIESTGINPALAGLVVAPYGVAVLIGTQIVRRMASSTPPWVPMTIGGAMAVAGYLVAALDQHVVAILCASVLIGGCYSFFHSTVQAWATDIAPEVRGTAAALFVTGAFTGGALGTGIGAMLVQAALYRELFLVAAALSVPVVIIATLARTRYRGTTLPSEAGAAVT
ncbi:MAG TPA: MFS transporter [Candidatus Baltobacterales bacterium]|nr:MFS transporter [Candidatus Baltobacterales bacterium]